MIAEWYFGFWNPSFRNIAGKVDFRCWFGHVCCFGYTQDGTWLFFDPKGGGPALIITHLHDEVNIQLEAHFLTCDSILRLPATVPAYRLPLHGPMMTCATICGYLVGLRAFLPTTLRRKLLAIGAEVMNGTEGRSAGQGGPTA